MAENVKNEIESFNKNNLKKATTKVIYLNGTEKYSQIDNTNDNGETVLSTKNSNSCDGFIKQLDPDLSCDEIIPNLYLSGDDVACNLELLKKKSITHILNLTTNVDNLFEKDGDIIYKRIIIYDLLTENILQYFPEAFEFIDNALLFSNKSSKNSVLVHCNAGVSRSASFIIGYLLKKNMFDNYKSAYEYVKECRPKIFPNKGFVEQLKIYEKTLNGNSI